MLSENLKAYREKKKLSMLKLAERANLSDRIISFIENGKIKNPKLSTLTALAKALEVTLEELIK